MTGIPSDEHGQKKALFKKTQGLVQERSIVRGSCLCILASKGLVLSCLVPQKRHIVWVWMMMVSRGLVQNSDVLVYRSCYRSVRTDPRSSCPLEWLQLKPFDPFSVERTNRRRWGQEEVQHVDNQQRLNDHSPSTTIPGQGTPGFPGPMVPVTEMGPVNSPVNSRFTKRYSPAIRTTWNPKTTGLVFGKWSSTGQFSGSVSLRGSTKA